MEQPSKLEDVLKLRRTALGLSQERLGKKIEVSGSAVSGWENGTRRPSVSLVPELSAALEMDAESLAQLVISSSR